MQNLVPLSKTQARSLAQSIKPERGALSAESDAALRVFLTLPPYKSSNVVCCYASTDFEIDTWQLMHRILRDGKRLCMPQIIGRHEMVMREVTSLDGLKEGRFRIPEPSDDCPVVEKEEIDLCVVPCVACGKNGVRLGRGAGFYDRYLEGTRFAKVALCACACLFDSIPSEKHDVGMDIIVSGGEVFYINEA